MVSQYASHRNPDFFPKAEECRPERWVDNLESRLLPGAYFPFLAGTRKCLGDQFALLEAQHHPDGNGPE